MNTPQTHAFWRKQVALWRASSLSQAQYCKNHNLKAHSLSYHKRRLETNREAVNESRFIAVPVPPALPAPKPLTLHFASGLSLSGIAPNNIDVVKQLTTALS
jgi:hypothetical protein